MPVQHAKAPEQAREDTSPRKIDVTSNPPVGGISVVTLIRTDTTLDHSQKAEKVWSALGMGVRPLLQFIIELPCCMFQLWAHCFLQRHKENLPRRPLEKLDGSDQQTKYSDWEN